MFKKVFLITVLLCANAFAQDQISGRIVRDAVKGNPVMAWYDSLYNAIRSVSPYYPLPVTIYSTIPPTAANVIRATFELSDTAATEILASDASRLSFRLQNLDTGVVVFGYDSTEVAQDSIAMYLSAGTAMKNGTGGTYVESQPLYVGSVWARAKSGTDSLYVEERK